MQFCGADTDQLNECSQRFVQAQASLTTLFAMVELQVRSVDWVGPDAERLREIELPRVMVQGRDLATRISDLGTQLADHATEQDTASAPDTSASAGRPDPGTAAELTEPSPSPGPSPVPPADGDHSRSRDPDGRSGRRVEADERGRGRDGSGHFSHDWAGRAILDRYLRGGGDWVLDHDPEWSQYMKENAENNPDPEGLGNRSRELNDNAARQALENYLATGATTSSHSETTNAVLDNGEGIVGSQYLHGSNADAGGFQYEATSTVVPNGDGTYTVTLDPTYTFNDRIDPNGQYRTDRVKSTIAEIITFGQADPYDIHISWGDPVTVVVDADGNPVPGSQRGWPY